MTETRHRSTCPVCTSFPSPSFFFFGAFYEFQAGTNWPQTMLYAMQASQTAITVVQHKDISKDAIAFRVRTLSYQQTTNLK